MYVRTASHLIGSQNPFSSVFQSVYNNRDYNYVKCMKAINNYKSGFAGFANVCECHGCHATWVGPVPGCSRISRLFITSTFYPEIFSKRLGGISQIPGICETPKLKKGSCMVLSAKKGLQHNLAKLEKLFRWCRKNPSPCQNNHKSLN